MKPLIVFIAEVIQPNGLAYEGSGLPLGRLSLLREPANVMKAIAN